MSDASTATQPGLLNGLNEILEPAHTALVVVVDRPDPHHHHAGLARGFDQLADARGERLVAAHIRALGGVDIAVIGAEIVLHVDDDEGAARGLQPREGVQPAAARQQDALGN